MSLKGNPEITLPLLTGVSMEPPRLGRREKEKDRGQTPGRKDKDKRDGRRPATTWQGGRGLFTTFRAPMSGTLDLRNWGPLTFLPLPCQSSALRLRLKVRSPRLQMCDSAAISQSGKRYPQGQAHLVQGGGGRQAERVPAPNN